MLARTTNIAYWCVLLNIARALTQDYCNENLPSNSVQKSSSDYMSNGLCISECQGYKYAIVQYQSCWCSDSDPLDIVSVSNCDGACPGYNVESCGSGSTYYGWLEVADDYISGSGASSFSYSSLAVSSTGTSENSASSTTISASSLAAASSLYSISESLLSSSSFGSTVSAVSTTTLAPTTSTSSSFSLTSSTSSNSSNSVSVTSDSYVSSSSFVSSSSLVTETAVPVETVVTTVEIAVTTHQSVTSQSLNSKATTAAESTQLIESVYTTVVVSTTIVPGNTFATSGVGSSNSNSNSKNTGFWQSKGKVGGTFFVVGFVILVLVLLLVYLFYVKPRNELKKQTEFEKTYNEIIKSNLRESFDDVAQNSSGVVAVNNALKEFQEFDSDISSTNGYETKVAGPVPVSPDGQGSGNKADELALADHPDFSPEYDMLESEDGEEDSGLGPESSSDGSEDFSEGDGDLSNEDILLPPRISLGALKVVNRSMTTIDKGTEDQEEK